MLSPELSAHCSTGSEEGCSGDEGQNESVSRGELVGGRGVQEGGGGGWQEGRWGGVGAVTGVVVTAEHDTKTGWRY